jgi:hypothetical protein
VGRSQKYAVAVPELTRGCIHRRIVVQKTKSFALTYSQLRISLVFTPTLGFPNTWFSSPQFGGFFYLFSLNTQGQMNISPPLDGFIELQLQIGLTYFFPF